MKTQNLDEVEGLGRWGDGAGLPSQSPAINAVRGLLNEFPESGSMTIAKIAYRLWPELWPNMEGARNCIRRLRGALGDQHRNSTLDRSNYQETKEPGDPFGRIPEPRDPFDTRWECVQVNGPCTALVLNDVHIPYHDSVALKMALGAGVDSGCDLILLNGDFLDCHAVSRWEKDPRKRDFKSEIKMTRIVLRTIRKAFPKARIIFKLGNHEERWESYMFCKSPELLGVREFELPHLLKFHKIGVECVREKRLIRLGDLNVLHGHEYRGGMVGPVNPARSLFLKAKSHAMCGHHHQSSYHQAKNVESQHIACWSVGCLCQLHQDYSPYNEWIHGFAIVHVDEDNKFEVGHHVITGGRIR